MPHRGKVILKPPDPRETTRTHLMGSEKEEEELPSNAGSQSMGRL